MISKGQALSRIRGLSSQDIRQLARQRLFGNDLTPVTGGYYDEPSEDLVIVLLSCEVPKELPLEVRNAVLAGCQDVYAQLLSRIAAPEGQDPKAISDQSFIRTCRVVDVIAPAELQAHASSLLALAIGNKSTPIKVIRATIRGCMGYPLTEEQIPLWEAVLHRREVAPYGFNALLKINPNSPRVERDLLFLWEQQLNNGWEIDAAFLTRRAARQSGSSDLIGRLLADLRQKAGETPDTSTFWQRFVAELQRRDWSKRWLEVSVEPIVANLASRIASFYPDRSPKDLPIIRTVQGSRHHSWIHISETTKEGTCRRPFDLKWLQRQRQRYVAARHETDLYLSMLRNRVDIYTPVDDPAITALDRFPAEFASEYGFEDIPSYDFEDVLKSHIGSTKRTA